MVKALSFSKISSALPGWLGYDTTKDGSAATITSSDITTINFAAPHAIRLSDTLQIAFYVKSDSDLYAKTLTISSGNSIAVGATENVLKSTVDPDKLYHTIHADRLSDTKFVITYVVFTGTSTYTLYARTFTVSGDTISADAAELSLGTVTSSVNHAVKASSATRAVVLYGASGGGTLTAIGLQIGSGSLAKDSSATTGAGTTSQGRIIAQEDSGSVATIIGSGAYTKFDFDATTTTAVASALTLTRYSFGSAAAMSILGFNLFKHPSADNRMIGLLFTGSAGDMTYNSVSTFLFQIDTSSTAVLSTAKIPDIGNSFYALTASDLSPPSGDVFTVGGKYFLIIPSWSTGNNASNGFYQGFTIVMLDWGTETPVLKVVGKDSTGNSLTVEADQLVPPMVVKLTETSFIYYYQDLGTSGFEAKVIQV